MASGVAYFSTNTDLGLVNALNQSLNLYLPLNAPNGKSLFIKDANGNSFKSTITVLTQGADTFEDGSIQQIINTPYESIQLAYTTTSNKWFITGGTMFNTLNVSTLRSQAISTVSISSLTASFSSLTTVDQRLQSTVGTLNSVSSLLYYNNVMVSAGLRFAPSQVLNRYTFSPISLPNLAGWYDAADPLGNGFLPANGTTLQTWFDKSANGNNATQANPVNRPTYNASNIVFNGTNNFLSFANPSAMVVNTSFSVFAVEQRATLNDLNFFVGGTSAAGNNNLHLGYRSQSRMTFGFYGNDIDFTGVPNFVPGNEPYRLWEFVFTNPNRNTLLNGTSVVTDTNRIPLQSWPGGCIGALLANAVWYNGSIRELLFYNKALTLGDQQRVEGYLAWKWGLQTSLPNSNPYKSAPP